MTTRQIVDAIHEGLPLSNASDGDTPSKGMVGEDLQGFIKRFSLIEKNPLFVPSPEEIDSIQAAVKAGTNIRTLIRQIRACMRPAFERITLDFIKDMYVAANETPEKKAAFRAFLKNHWQRYQVMRDLGAADLRKENADSPEERLEDIAFVGVMVGGVENVAYHALASVCVTPAVHKEQTEKCIDPEGWHIAGQSSLDMMKQIASAESNVFMNGLIWAMRHKDAKPQDQSNPYDPFDWPAYDPWAFRLNAEGKIGLHQRIIEPTRNELMNCIGDGIKVTNDRQGCAARAAFPPVHKRVMLAVKDGILPFADHILSLPAE